MNPTNYYDPLWNMVGKKYNDDRKALEEINLKLESAPQGRLRISHKKKRDEYYVNAVSSNATGYLRKGQQELAYAIAQRDYYQSIQKILTKDVKSLQQFLKKYDPAAVANAFDKLPDTRKKLIKPMAVSDEEFIEKWKNSALKTRNEIPINSDTYTNGGVHVRSKSEKFIGDALEKYGIPYQYERPMMLKDGQIVFPDFTILDMAQRKCYIWEHLGMLGDENYSSRTCSKLDKYIKNGIFPGENLIITGESSTYSFNTTVIDILIKKYFLHEGDLVIVDF